MCVVLAPLMGNHLPFLTLSSSLKEDLHLCLLELHYDTKKVTSLSFLPLSSGPDGAGFL